MLLGPVTVKPLLMLAGYLWPSYQTYKAVSVSNNTHLKFWCIYWMIMGAFLTVEWLADALVFWLPLYYEAKLLFILYLWHPKFYGAVTVYEKVVMPLMRTHEANIDSTIESTRARVTDSFTRQVSRLRDVASQNTNSFIEAARKFSETAGDTKSVKDGARKNVHTD